MAKDLFNVNDLRKHVEQCVEIRKVYTMKATDDKIHIRFSYRDEGQNFFKCLNCNINRPKKISDKEINDIVRMIMSKEVM